MHVVALGLSPLKGGTRHHPAAVELDHHGPVGDRRFCCVDPVARRVLRTVENPALLRLRVDVEPGSGGSEVLAVDVPGVGRIAAPVLHDGPLQAEYWGRRPRLTVLTGPWAEALSGYLGRRVVLAEAAPRGVVYAGGVTVVTTSSLRELARRAGTGAGDAAVPTSVPSDAAVLRDAERWRANLVLDSGDAPPFVEDGWVGRRLRVGGVVLDVRAGVPRCAVVRLVPGSGARERWDPLALLAPDRVRGREVHFGVDCEVLTPGTVAVGDRVDPG